MTITNEIVEFELCVLRCVANARYEGIACFIESTSDKMKPPINGVRILALAFKGAKDDN